MAKKKGPTRIELAAGIFGCEVGELMGQHEFEDGSVAIIAPTGQKFVYSAEDILEEQVKQQYAAMADSEQETAQETAKASGVVETLGQPGELGGNHVVEERKPASRKRRQ